MLQMVWHGPRVSLTVSFGQSFPSTMPTACQVLSAHVHNWPGRDHQQHFKCIRADVTKLMYVRIGIYMAHCLSHCKGAINFHNTIIIQPCINFHNNDIIAMNYVPLYKINNTGMHYNHEHIGMHMVSIILQHVVCMTVQVHRSNGNELYRLCTTRSLAMIP